METWRIPLPLGEGGAQRRVREARSTILSIDEIVGRAALIRRIRATFSQREKGCFFPIWT
jgi:hypothetical protein